MLTFGFIADNIIEIPNGLTPEEFQEKFKRTLFNSFFDVVEQGCTKFYTPFQNIYSCIAINIIKRIGEISDIDIEIYVLYADNDEYLAALSTPCYKAYNFEKSTNKIIFSELNHDFENSQSNTNGNIVDLQKFNVLMNLVEECSVVVFYNSEEVIEQNSNITTAHNYCENYSISHINLYDNIQ